MFDAARPPRLLTAALAGVLLGLLPLGGCGGSGAPDCVPTAELCNGRDDDCNGTIDDVAPVSCYTGPIATEGIGPCRAGTRTCVGGADACAGEVVPVPETCNGADDDCDASVDDGLTCP